MPEKYFILNCLIGSKFASMQLDEHYLVHKEGPWGVRRNSCRNFLSDHELPQPTGKARFSSQLEKKKERKTPLVMERAKGKRHVLQQPHCAIVPLIL